LLDEILKRDFSKRQLNILLFIIRYSYGFGKKACVFEHLSDFQQCGIARQTIKQELETLVEAKVIIWDTKLNIFELNKNYDTWQISNHKFFNTTKREMLIKYVLGCTQNINNIVHKILTGGLIKYEQCQADEPDTELDTYLPKEIKENKEIKKDTYIKDDFLNFLSEKNVKLDFGLVDIKKTEYDVLFSRVLNAGVVKTEQEAETLLIEIIKEYDTWRAKGKGSENQFADLITFTKNRIRDIKNDSSKIKPLKPKQEREPDPYDLFFASLKRGG